MCIRDRLDAEKLKPSAEADRVTLLRRLHLDLTGLLPSIAEAVSYTHLRAHETVLDLVCRLLLEKKKTAKKSVGKKSKLPRYIR